MTREATVIVGFECRDIFKKEDVKKPVTRYDSMTGKPYTQHIWGDHKYIFGDIELTESTYKSYFNELGLTYVDLYTLGIEITTCYNYEERYIELDVITNAKEKVEKILEQLRWNYKVKLIVSCEFDNDDDY